MSLRSDRGLDRAALRFVEQNIVDDIEPSGESLGILDDQDLVSEDLTDAS
jgi:hypothetical protein